MDWTDEYMELMESVFEKLVKRHNLKSGDLSPEDTLTLCQILERFVKNNTTKEKEQ